MAAVVASAPMATMLPMISIIHEVVRAEMHFHNNNAKNKKTISEIKKKLYKIIKIKCFNHMNKIKCF